MESYLTHLSATVIINPEVRQVNDYNSYMARLLAN
ncbi:protein of unknown function [Kyrpidia spormannii]|uniref:Uncharacterized protein n=2 Tax=Kyrpidia spormannii TaxID=2055160 RepID=A0ACA8ZCX2_9BACL|nr:protein of unknown function [Kyrpidia spormannii]CAB3395840.1 protein of unknown function [Kyrpidia spormannii]